MEFRTPIEANGRESNFYPNLYSPANAALLASDGTICTGVATPTASCTGASPGLGSSPNPILNGYQFYLNGLGYRRQEWYSSGLGGQSLGCFRSACRFRL